MKKRRQNKSGFTLVELMVVAIIVAILAAVAVPIMTGNKGKAMATEAKTACGTIATQIRLYYVENGADAAAPTDWADLDMAAADLKGTYYEKYSFSVTGPQKFMVFVAPNGDAPAVSMDVKDGATTWGSDTVPTAPPPAPGGD